MSDFSRFIKMAADIAVDSFGLSMINRRIMADSARREEYSATQLRKFLLYSLLFPFLNFYALIARRPPRASVHFLWAEKIRATVIDVDDIILLPFPSTIRGTLQSWFIASIAVVIRLKSFSRIKGISARIEFMAFLVEIFVIDTVMLTEKLKSVTTASALDRKSIYISKLAQHFGIKHVVYQHGVINKFDGVHIPRCDVFVCCFPWSVQAVPWIYEASTVEVLSDEQWFFPGWDNTVSMDILWVTSPLSRLECLDLIEKIRVRYDVSRIIVKPHPRDRNIELYSEMGLAVTTLKARKCQLIIGQISTVLAEAAVLGIPTEVIVSESTRRKNCLDLIPL
jgi:hypothetical protein